MNIITAAALAVMILLAWHVWEDYRSSGRFTRQTTRGLDIFFAGIILVTLWVVSRENALWYSLDLFVVYRGIQYLWYAGCLSGIRSRFIKNVCEKWRRELQSELEFIASLEKTFHPGSGLTEPAMLLNSRRRSRNLRSLLSRYEALDNE